MSTGPETSPAPAPTPLYILTWRLPARGRGRKHMGLFIPDDDYVSIPPHTSLPNGGRVDEKGTSCKGTLLQAVGSPFSGYMHSFVRGSEARGVKEIEQAVKVGEVSPLNVPGAKVEAGKTVGQMLEQHASRVQAPGVAKRPWVAEDIRNCQDWLVDLTAYLVQRRVVGEDVLEAVKAQMEVPVPVMPAPSGVRTSGAEGQEERPVTASLGLFSGMADRLPDQHTASSSQSRGEASGSKEAEHDGEEDNKE